MSNEQENYMKKRFLRCALILLVVVLGAAVTAGADDAQEAAAASDPWRDFPVLPVEIETTLMESIIKSGPWSLPAKPKTTPFEAEINKNYWTGARVRHHLKFKDIEVHFKFSEEGKAKLTATPTPTATPTATATRVPGTPVMVPVPRKTKNVITEISDLPEPESEFDVFVTFDADELVVRHSSPRLRIQQGGFRLKYPVDKPVRFFLGGTRRSGVLVYVPTTPSEAFLRTVILCPRDMIRTSATENDKVLENPGYVFDGIRVRLEGQGQAEFLTGLDRGFGEISMSVSPNVRIPDQSFDRSSTKDPFVSLLYFPRNDELPLIHPTGGEVRAGARFDWDLRLPTGYRRQSSVTRMLWAKGLNLAASLRYMMKTIDLKGTAWQPRLLSEELPLVVNRALDMSVSPGTCVAVVEQEWDLEHKYSKVDPEE